MSRQWQLIVFILDLPSVLLKESWNAPFDIRLQQLVGGEYRIAFYYGLAPDNGTFRYRVYNMANSLNGLRGKVTAACFYQGDLDRLPELINQIDILVICRGKYCERLGHVITAARNKGKRIIFDIDDLMFDPKYMHLVLRTADADYSRFTQDEVWQYWYGDCARYAATMSLCDWVVTTNNFLAERIREYSGKDVSVVPNYLNEEQLDISRKIYRQKRDGNYARKNPLYLGYFSGSHTHNHDFRILTDALEALFDKYDDLKLRVVGLLDLDKRLTRWSGRIERLPVQNYVDLQKYIGEVEINLIPLQVNVFTNCKSDLKYFEAAITGTISIASPVYAYTKAIRNNHNGLLSEAYEWFTKIDEILSNMQIYRDLSEKAFRHAEENYSWKKLLPVIERAYLA